MKHRLVPALALVLAAVVAPGCRPVPASSELFEAWEVGRTLIFENPSLPDTPPANARFHERFQKQVIRSTDAGGGKRIETLLSTFQGQKSVELLIKDGGVTLLDPQGKGVALLPEGFPDKVSSWESPGYRMRILGRARWEREKPEFPATRPPEGIWVEGEPLQGDARIRIFFLPDFGQVEKREWRDGRWITTNLMVGWSFQEIPRPK